jgi:hypothetical protein
MKNLILSAITITGALFASVIDAEAGPRPGSYRGKTKRECSKASPVERSVQTTATASNPSDPEATFSTKVRCSSRFGTGDFLNVALDVLPDGRVSATVNGQIPRKGKSPLGFSATGKAPGTYTDTSFAATIPNVMVNGKKATLTVSAASKGTKLKVDVKIDPENSSHPLGSDYEAEFEGQRL